MQDKTRERIIESAFSLYGEVWEQDVSLSRIAERVGISKAAIFRHFPDKRALLDEMKKRIFSQADSLLSVSFENESLNNSRMSDLIAALCRRPDELLFMHRLFLRAESLEFEPAVFLHKEFRLAAYDEEAIPLLRGLFISSFAVQNALEYVCMYRRGETTQTPDDFAQALTELLCRGWGGLLEDFDSADFERMYALSAADRSVLGEEDRFFTVLSQILHQDGIAGLTVERLARGCRMAKSSLYSRAKSKHGLIAQASLHEIESFIAFKQQRIGAAASLGEAVFLLMASTLEYFCARPNLVPVIGWLRMYSRSIFSASDEALLAPLIPDRSPPFPSPAALSAWIESLIGGAVLHRGAIVRESLRPALPRYYQFMREGLEPAPAGAGHADRPAIMSK